MKIGKRWPLYLLFIVVGVTGTRLAWRLSVSETGWAPHLGQWAESASSLVGVRYQELGDRDPAEQARFWLREVERVGKDDDPQMAMGAAWVLDAPQPGFMRRHVRMRAGMEFSGFPASWRRELDDVSISSLSEEFERLCRDKCLAKIERAVQLEPTNVELRRARALLLFQLQFMSFDSVPRSENWLTILDECARVDPDNALYDYLAALHLWKSSATYEWQDDGYLLNVKDQSRFEEGNARLVAGLAKRDLKFGTEGYAATLAFLNETSVSRSDSLAIAGSRQIDRRASSFLFEILRWKNVQRNVEKRAGRFDSAVSAVRDVLAISEQVTESDNEANLLNIKLIMRRWGLANLKDIHEHHPDVLSAAEAAAVSQQLVEVQRELKILEEVGRRMTAKTRPATSKPSPVMSARGRWYAASFFLMTVSPFFVIPCVVLVIISSLVSILFGRNDDGNDVPLGWLRQMISWLLGFCISFVLFGMFPAEIVPASAQAWIICIAVWVAFGCAIFGLLHLFHRGFELPVSQVAALALVAALLVFAVIHPTKILELAVVGIMAFHPMVSIALIFVLALSCWAASQLLRRFAENQNLSSRGKLFAVGAAFLMASVAVFGGTAVLTLADESWVRIPPTVWDEAQDLHFDASELQTEMKLNDSKWLWAVIQWMAYRGPCVAAVIAAALLMIWHLLRSAARVQGGLRQLIRSQMKREIHHSARAVGGSCLVATLIFLTLYLVTTPLVADQMDIYQRVHVDRMTRPAQVWKEVADLTAQVKADKAAMAGLQAEIDEYNNKVAKQKAWEAANR